ncbi:MAG TPA: peptide chain release factor N(5)-glutamine methyltransferase [Burkholderiaceae bacterium]|nr:peptide chain release factor N(5)-glutamine methyltransferase [Burkholderiaceae bacterium]
MNVEQALAAARERGLSRLDGALLLANRLEQRREWLIAHPLAPVPMAALAAFTDDCRRRADGVPVAYLTGRREFMGHELLVTADVLVPRPETETLAQWAIERLHMLRSHAVAPRVIDLGTGSGALAVALGAACPGAEITATDCSAAALAVARANAHRLGLHVRLAEGDWWSAVAGERFDLAVANPPYIAEGDAHLAALRHEPRHALVAGGAGLDSLARVIEHARKHLSGWLLLEHGWDQADPVSRLLSQAGLSCIETRRDLNGLPRCTGGCTT